MVEKVRTFTKTHLVAILASAIIACFMLSAGGAWAKYTTDEDVTGSLNLTVTSNFTIVYHGNGGSIKDGDDTTITTYTQTCALDTAAGTLKEDGTLIANKFTNGNKTFGFWTVGTEKSGDITTTSTNTCVNEHAFPKEGDSIITPTTAGRTIHLWAYWLDEGAGNYWMESAKSDHPGQTVDTDKGQSEIDKNQNNITTFWNNFYSKNGTEEESHLYAIWQEDTVQTFANRFVESRIIQVGAHDSDTSAVTFMATHSLPTAKQMNPKTETDPYGTNTTGWSGSAMRTTMNADGGYVMTGLSKLSGAVKAVNKMQATYDSANSKWNDTASLSDTTDTFWLISYSEIAGEGKVSYFKNEGSQYDWCKTNVTEPTGDNTALANMDKTRDGINESAGASTSHWWERSPNVDNITSFGHVRTAGNPGLGDYSSYEARGVVPCFSMGTAFTVTFDPNGGSLAEGTSATQSVAKDGHATAPTSDPTYTGYEFEGWYTKDDSGELSDTAYDFANTPVTANLTLYAKWKESKYWFATAGLDDPTSETPYKTQSRIDADIAKIEQEIANGTYENDGSTYKEYEALMTSETYHLYTKWNSPTDTESSSAVTTGKNAYVEFRIIQVGEHDGDGSAVTFMATHSLPTAKKMNNEDTPSVLGWKFSLMRTDTMTNYVKAGLSGLCTDDESTGAKTIDKVAIFGGSGPWKELETSDQFWLLSHSEIYGTTSYLITNGGFFKAEGTQYQWFYNKGITCTGYNEGENNDQIANLYLTRAGEEPADPKGKFGWLRSPNVDVSSGKYFFGNAFKIGGTPAVSNASFQASVLPCFAMGTTTQSTDAVSTVSVEESVNSDTVTTTTENSIDNADSSTTTDATKTKIDETTEDATETDASNTNALVNTAQEKSTSSDSSQISQAGASTSSTNGSLASVYDKLANSSWLAALIYSWLVGTA